MNCTLLYSIILNIRVSKGEYMRNIYSALDIGSDSIKLVCGEFIHGKLNVLCAEKTYSLGYQNNVIMIKMSLYLV